MRFLYNKMEQKNIVGLFANGSYKLGFLLKKKFLSIINMIISFRKFYFGN